jgi:flagellar hook assembly protein FlgD
MYNRLARLGFSIVRKERVEIRLYDVSGRAVRTLANREFTAGEHEVVWDGSDDAGRAVPRGVYFFQLRTPSFVSQKKLAMLAR